MNDIRNKIIKVFCEDKIPGGLSDNKTLTDLVKHHYGQSSGPAYTTAFYLLKNELQDGIKHEMEHTSDPKVANEIAMDHLWEDPDYYSKLNKGKE